MQGTSKNLEYFFERRKIQRLEQQSHEVADQIRQMKEDLEELESLHTSGSLDETSNPRSPKGRLENEMKGQPWGNYIFLVVLLLLLIGVNVGL
ncbi:MAG: hypothetical protein F6J95_030495 [Leptolyngbya sp. SIO1E4]|nr:hypothetical protein [Leptolyngbya sp. SIO1E4]